MGKKESLFEATKWLDAARNKRGTGDVDYFITQTREELEKAGATLKDIGTDEEELDERLKNFHLEEAKKWLEVAQNQAKPGNIEYFMGYIRGHLEEAGATPKDIGTDEEELSKLLQILQ